MKIRIRRSRTQEGAALVTTVVFSGILMIVIASILQLSSYRLQTEYARASSNQAFYHAENALNWVAQRIADAAAGDDAVGQYSVEDGTLGLGYQTALKQGEDPKFVESWVTVKNHPSGVDDLYLVTSSSKVGTRTRTLQANIRKNPPSVVFDYEYFLNNWGWWWGASITGNGDNRANWDFDFRYNPTVNGAVLANGQIESNLQPVDPLSGTPPFGGLAGKDPVSYVKTGVPRVAMPNLLETSYYEEKARAQNGTLSVGIKLLVDAVHTNISKPGIYLSGTAAAPIRIDGPVVIPGDVIIKGVITGRGTLYVGGNLYIAGEVTYKNGPNFSVKPALLPEADRDKWVEQALDEEKDLVAFAVAESILGGEVNGSHWKSTIYDPSGYGLKHVGNEANLGQDGIPGTGDDGVAWRDTDGDGEADSAWYDSDGDGKVDSNYSYDADIKLTGTRLGKVAGYPVDDGSPVSYNSVSTDYMNRLDGIFYSNHAAGIRLRKNKTVWNGGLICRDEAIVFSSSLDFNYDPRVHSRYSDDPNRYIDLGLPVARKVRIESFTELAPQEGFYTTVN